MVVDESLLTGESVGISKDTTKGKNSGFMGTIVLKRKRLNNNRCYWNEN